MNFYDCFFKKSIVLGFCEKAKEKKSVLNALKFTTAPVNMKMSRTLIALGT